MARNKTEQLESLWQSPNPTDTARFFLLNHSVTDLVRFSRRRPRADVKVRSLRTNSSSRIVVVIPTANAEGPLASRAVRIFGDLAVILVESKGPFFNYSTSLNRGIREALDAKPDWIVVSNDDVLQRDSAASLARQIQMHSSADYMLARPTALSSPWQHSMTLELANYSTPIQAVPRIMWSFFNGSTIAAFFAIMLERKYGIDFAVYPVPERERGATMIGPKRFLYGAQGVFSRRTRLGLRFRNFSSFGVFRASLFHSLAFDETFINGYEDTDLALSLVRNGFKSALLDYEIGHMRGKSLAPTTRLRSVRLLHEMMNISYFCEKNRTFIGEWLARKGSRQ